VEDASGANAAQREYWNAARQWVDDRAGHDEMLEPLGRLAQGALAPSEGMRILDIGCGTGATTLELADAVGPSGEAVGADVSGLLLEVARARAAGRPNVSFLEADAQTHAFEAESFDGAFSRFGFMFFDDPEAAFVNIRVSLRPGSRLAFVCWQGPDRNEWVTVPMAAARDLVDVPVDTGSGPGPFAFSDEDLLMAVLDGAGFPAVSIESHTQSVLLGGHGDVETALAFVLSNRIGRQILEVAGEDRAPEIVAALRRSLEPYATSQGVEIGAAVWLVTARRA
jgi:SAM-dependent methyltransferase